MYTNWNNNCKHTQLKKQLFSKVTLMWQIFSCPEYNMKTQLILLFTYPSQYDEAIPDMIKILLWHVSQALKYIRYMQNQRKPSHSRYLIKSISTF